MTLDIIAIIVSICALTISTWSWRRSRNIYGIEHHLYRHTEEGWPGHRDLKEKLNSGNYTILNTYYDAPYIAVIIGRIKK